MEGSLFTLRGNYLRVILLLLQVRRAMEYFIEPVSYTHLTLPTIYSV